MINGRVSLKAQREDSFGLLHVSSNPVWSSLVQRTVQPNCPKFVVKGRRNLSHCSEWCVYTSYGQVRSWAVGCIIVIIKGVYSGVPGCYALLYAYLPQQELLECLLNAGKCGIQETQR